MTDNSAGYAPVTSPGTPLIVQFYVYRNVHWPMFEELFHFLGTHPDVAERIVCLPSLERLRSGQSNELADRLMALGVTVTSRPSARPVDITFIADTVAGQGERRVGGEQPPQDLRVAVSAVAQHRQEPGQRLDHVRSPGSGDRQERLRNHRNAVAAHRQQLTFPQLLVHLRHRYTQQLCDGGEVVHRFTRVENVLTGRNAAHRFSLGPDPDRPLRMGP